MYIYVCINICICIYIYIYIYIYIMYTRDKYYKHCCCIRLFLNVIKVLLVCNPNYSICFPPGWN